MKEFYVRVNFRNLDPANFRLEMLSSAPLLPEIARMWYDTVNEIPYIRSSGLDLPIVAKDDDFHSAPEFFGISNSDELLMWVDSAIPDVQYDRYRRISVANFVASLPTIQDAFQTIRPNTGNDILADGSTMLELYGDGSILQTSGDNTLKRLNVGFIPQLAGTFLAGPASGGPGVPSFRELLLSDFPPGLDFYTRGEIDDFFEGESLGKKQIDWLRVINRPDLEPYLGLPPADNYVLASLTDGTRFWTPAAGTNYWDRIGDMLVPVTNTDEVTIAGLYLTDIPEEIKQHLLMYDRDTDQVTYADWREVGLWEVAPSRETIYGYLYNFYAIRRHESGFFMPSEGALQLIRTNLFFAGKGNYGPNEYASSTESPSIYNVTSQPRWDSSAVWGDDAYNFSIYPTGRRSDIDATYLNPNTTAFFWTSTSYSATEGAIAEIYYSADDVGASSSDKKAGLAVRFMRDATAPELLLDDGDFVTGYTGNDGDTYTAIKIGAQVWMAENLRETQYADTTVIPGNLTNGQWLAQDGTLGKDGAWAVYDPVALGLPSEAEVIATRGRLYNHYAVLNPLGLSSGVDGWRVPTDAELFDLLTYINSTPEYDFATAGKALKGRRQLNYAGPEDRETYRALNFAFNSWSDELKSKNTQTIPIRTFESEDIYNLGDETPYGTLIFHIIDLGGGLFRYYEAPPDPTGFRKWVNDEVSIKKNYLGTVGQIAASESNTIAIVSDPDHTQSLAKDTQDYIQIGSERISNPSSDFRVPEQTDWTDLFLYINLNYGADVGRQLKSGRTVDGVPAPPIPTDDHPRWNYHPLFGIDSVGLSLVPGGARYVGGLFADMGLYANYWSSTKVAAAQSTAVGFDYNSTGYLLNTTSPERYGYSMRLVRDATVEEGLSVLDGTPLAKYIGNDGKEYHTVKIGLQVWLAENLAETKYADGTDIPNVTSNATWAADLDGALSAYDNDEDFVEVETEATTIRPVENLSILLENVFVEAGMDNMIAKVSPISGKLQLAELEPEGIGTATNKISIDFTNPQKIIFDVVEANVDHDALGNYQADRHRKMNYDADIKAWIIED